MFNVFDIDTDHDGAVILAEGFDINSGSVDVTVPNVFFGADYSVVRK